MDYGNRAEGRVDGFHPRRLLLSGPPQVGAVPADPAQARPPGPPWVLLPADRLGAKCCLLTLCGVCGCPGFISVAAVIRYPDTEKLGRERVYFSSRFQVTVYHGREVKAART